MTVTRQAAIYARVSSEQQAQTNTIASQIAALRERVQSDELGLSDKTEFIDEGYSGSNLVRPALERLRDAAASGLIDRLYIHSPDRLARKYAYQVLLIDELQRSGVEITFLNRELSKSPEDELLLQVQGMMAEYERAKIIERNRRGRRYAAKTGSVNVLGCAPYGYRYISKQEGGGQARLEIIAEQARVVRQIFDWIGGERLTIGEVCRRLSSAGEQTRRGNLSWDRTAVWGMLKNPTYKGEAAFGKTRNGAVRPRLRAQRGRPLQPRRGHSCYDVPVQEWITIPVPAIVDADLWQVVQEQLKENQRKARTVLRGASYLLQGLISCKQCGYAFCGKAITNKARKDKLRSYAYYRCVGTDAYRFAGQRVCHNTQLRTDTLDLAVWQKVRGLLEYPDHLAEEYVRRLNQTTNTDELSTIKAQITKLQRGVDRLIDSYTGGFIEKGEFEPRISGLKQRIAQLTQQAQNMNDQAALQTQLKLIVGRLEDFTSKVKGSLDTTDWATKRDIIRALVKSVEVGKEAITVVFRVNPPPFESRPERGVLQHCGRRSTATLGYGHNPVGVVDIHRR
jgi:site-specific DNA recombinase